MKKIRPVSRKTGILSPKPAGRMNGKKIGGSVSRIVIDEASLLADLRALIQSARQRVATVANATQTMLYWHVGRRLLKANLQDGRAAYGKRILAKVSRELFDEFGEGFSYSSLTRMVRFAETMTDEAIVVTLSQQLSWSHFLALLPIKDPLARDFYAAMCRIEHWDVAARSLAPENGPPKTQEAGMRIAADGKTHQTGVAQSRHEASWTVVYKACELG